MGAMWGFGVAGAEGCADPQALFVLDLVVESTIRKTPLPSMVLPIR